MSVEHRMARARERASHRDNTKRYKIDGESSVAGRRARTSEASATMRAKAIAAAKERAKLLRAKP